jgi:hypothetical protein
LPNKLVDRIAKVVLSVLERGRETERERERETEITTLTLSLPLTISSMR